MKNVSRFVRFLSLGLTALLLLASVGSQSGHAVGLDGPGKKAQTAKAPKSSGAHHAVVSELSPMATATPVVLHFAQDFFLMPPVSFEFEAVRNLLPSAPALPIRLSYFVVLFQHFIVINAP